MSRAFMRDVDDAPLPPPVERSISAAPNRVTPRGARLIREEIAALEKKLTMISGTELASVLRRDLRYWLSRLASMQVVTPNPGSDVVGFGTRVTISRNGVVSGVTIVGEDEAEPSVGLIAWTAPLARALEGAEVGDIIELDAGGRLQPVTVVAVAAAAEGDGPWSYPAPS